MLVVATFIGALVGFGMAVRGRGCRVRVCGWLLLLLCLVGFLLLVSQGH